MSRGSMQELSLHLEVTIWWQSVPGLALAIQVTGDVWPINMWRGGNCQVSVDSSSQTITWPGGFRGSQVNSGEFRFIQVDSD